jgi:phage terminase large subunit-like protein
MTGLINSLSCENPIIEYWRAIEAGDVVVGDKVRRVYRKLVADITDPDSPYYYDEVRALHPIFFCKEYCKHSKGEKARQPLDLELWQMAITAAAYGIIDKKTGLRRFREVILIVARKNGKSTWSAGLGNYMLTSDNEEGPEVYSLATKKDQAKIIWKESKSMCQKSPALAKRTKRLVAEIICPENDGFYRPLCSESDGLDGLNVHAAFIDELHAIKNKNLYDVVIDGMSARRQPLVVITSTAGTVREGIFDLKYEECEKIINGYTDGQYKDDSVLPVIYELDAPEEWHNEKNWRKANPGLGTIKNVTELRRKVKKAEADPRIVRNLLCKDFNIRATVGEAWLNFDDVNNETAFDIDALKPRYGIGGADLSSTTDLTAAAVLFRLPDDENIYFEVMYWLPEDLLEKRSLEDKVPYNIWADIGLLRTTPGNKVHHKFVTDWFLEMKEKHDIYLPWIGYDSWSANYWVEDMKGVFGPEAMEAVKQGKQTLSSPMNNMGADFIARRIVYNNNPITKWCITNVAVDVDRNGNIQPCKTNNQRRRIDGFAAMLNAYVVMENHLEDYMNMI